MRKRELQNLIRDLQTANSNLQVENAALKADSDFIKNDATVSAFVGATVAQIKTQMLWDTMSDDDKVRWEKVLKLIKALALSTWEE